MKESNWNGRAFTSLCSLVGFIILCLTGIILYIEPHGRVAYWTKWHFLGLEKDQLGNIHVYSGLLFLLAGGFHLYYNWTPLIKYISSKIERSFRYKRELIISSLICLLIIFSGIWSLPPLSYVSTWGETIKNSWIISPDLEPPFGHAELVSLNTFCKKQQIPLDQAMTALKKAGFTVNSPKDTLTQIADSKNSSGLGVYQVIKKLEIKPEYVKSDTNWTAAKIEETFAGTGLGNKTIGQIIKDLGLESTKVRQRLNTLNMNATAEDTLKKLSKKHNTTPIKLLTRILVEES